ncbi:MAG: energy transducer TonB [Proteiniphilum sp.]|jgi:TonB family protein|nr:energy transducer TonB [Proteiniphilum sp.]MDD4158848.1 energy transducer TonB [Proteiniphilum sp.]MDD4800487.1 energy transducer TonB [Proteiniphilum sp.]
MKLPTFPLLLALALLAGSLSGEQSGVMAQEPPHSHSDRIIEHPDILPMYTGGTSEMHRFISNTLSYPADAAERNIQGLVVCTFVVEKDGTLSNYQIIHRADPLLDAEALRILQLMPPWRPARHHGQIVRAESYVPMYFKLNKHVRRMSAKTCPSESATARAYAKTDPAIIEEGEILTIVDRMPRYAYGEEELAAFIAHNIRYPKEARQQGVKGRILCSFIVGKDGSISNIEVVEGLHPQLDNEAIRVLGLMPRWTPGENGGEKVNVKCLLPIDFTIEEEPIPAV